MSFQHKEPYRQKTSIIYHAFRMAQKGSKISTIVKTIHCMEGDADRILKRLRSGQGGHFKWDVEEYNGWIKISNIKPLPRG